MKLSILTKVLTAGVVTLSAFGAFNQPSQAQNTAAKGFYCDTSSGVPVTVYQNAQGASEPWIRWVSNTFRSAGYDPLTRCQEVSARLENYRLNKQLRYITVGMMNRQRVVCTASVINGRCENLIFTLKPNQDAVRTLNNLLAWREGQAGVSSLNESGAVPYIDVSGRLGEDGNSNAPSTRMNTPTNVQPAPQTGSPREL